MKVRGELLFQRRRKLPAMIAAEASECGLACVGMIAAFHGHDVDLNGLRQRFPLSLAGVNLRGISWLADQLQLSPRSLKVELEALRRLQLPAILHWDLSHFVVLSSLDRRGAIIHDPAIGPRRVTLEELSQHFTGVAVELRAGVGFAPIRARIPISLLSLWSRLHGVWSSVAQVLVLSAALQVTAFIIPFQLQLVIDQGIGQHDAQLLWIIALGFGALAVLQGVIEILRGWTLQLLGSQVVYQVVGNLVHHLLRLPSEYFEKRHVGDIMSRLGSTRPIKEALTTGLIASIIDGIMAIIAAAVLFFYSPLLAVIVLASFALIASATIVLYPTIRARNVEVIRATANEQSMLMESVRAVTTIRLMGREADREGSWRNLYVKTFNASVSLGRYQLSLATVQTTVLSVQTVLVIFIAARLILAGGGFSIGMLIAFLSFRQTFSDRALSLVSQALQFRLLGVHVQRLGDIIVQPAESTASTLSVNVTGAIDARAVSFRYGSTDRWVVNGLSLAVEPGSFIAITGASGCGKTTLLKLLLGLHQPLQGEIRLDGQVASGQVWRAWRQQVGVVTQDDKLLSGSLADNIAFFDPVIDMTRVKVAAEAAQIHHEIARMPMNYQTLVGDMGSTLSGGQYQRVLLARALYRDPKVLVLDEGTANLDEATELAIAEIVSSMPITRIVVAHRPALVLRAERVFAMSGGSLQDVSESWAERRTSSVQRLFG